MEDIEFLYSTVQLEADGHYIWTEIAFADGLVSLNNGKE